MQLTHIRNLLLVPLVFLVAGASSCEEAAQHVKDWADKQSDQFYHDAIYFDGKTRFANTFRSGLSEVLSNLTVSASQINSLQSQAQKLLQITIPPESSLQTMTSVYYQVFDSFVTYTAAIGNTVHDVEDESASLDRVEQLCDNYGKEFLIPPADIAGLAGAMGEEQFTAYLSLSASMSESGGNGVEYHPDYGGMARNFITDMGNWLIDTATHLFGGSTLMDQARQELLSKLPTEVQRTAIVNQACRDVRSDANNQQNIAALIADGRAGIFELQSQLGLLNSLTAARVYALYVQLGQRAIAESQYSLQAVDDTILAVWQSYRDIGSAEQIVGLARRAYLESRIGLADRDCGKAQAQASNFNSKLRILQTLATSSEQVSDIYGEKIQNFADRANSLNARLRSVCLASGGVR